MLDDEETENLRVVNISEIILNVTDYFLRPTRKRFHFLWEISESKYVPLKVFLLAPHLLILQKKTHKTPSSLFTKSCLRYKQASMVAAPVFASRRQGKGRGEGFLSVTMISAPV